MMESNMSGVDVYNCTDSPVVVDDMGHILGGREHGYYDEMNERLQGLQDRNMVVITDRKPLREEEEPAKPRKTHAKNHTGETRHTKEHTSAKSSQATEERK